MYDNLKLKLALHFVPMQLVLCRVVCCSPRLPNPIPLQETKHHDITQQKTSAKLHIKGRSGATGIRNLCNFGAVDTGRYLESSFQEGES